MRPFAAIAYAFDGSTEPEVVAVGAASAPFTTVLRAGEVYEVTSTVAAWIKLATSEPTAAAATSGNLLVPANTPTRIAVKDSRNRLAIVRADVDGTACLARLVPGSLT